MKENRIKEYMKDWARDYERHRDILRKDIISIESEKDSNNLLIKYKDRERCIIPLPELKDAESLDSELKERSHATIITINSKENVNFIVDNWNILLNFIDLIIIFINPFSAIENKWMIKPYIHNMITEKESLKPGIISMSSTVEYITEKKFLEKIS